MRTTGAPARMRARLRSDRGQLIVEFTGMLPIILVTLVLLWQAVLVGYTFTLASGAADEGVRKVAGADAGDGAAACDDAMHERLPGAWEDSAEINCLLGGDDMVKVSITLKAPVLFPGFGALPVPITAVAGAAAEGK